MANAASDTGAGNVISGANQGDGPAKLQVKRIITFFLFLMVVCAPHSIAATQIAWACALLLWIVAFALRPRGFVPRTPIDYPLAVFVLLTIVSAFFSYDRDVSLPLLRGVSLFTIIYLFAHNISSRRTLRLLALTLIASCMLNVFYTLGERIAGRGVKIQGVTAGSTLRAAMFVNADGRETLTPIQDGDVLLEINGRRLRSPEELVVDLEGSNAGSDEAALVKIYRSEWTPVLKVPRGRLLSGATALERLGVTGWSQGREWRAAGFYGHYTTYAEVLQLIASLALGLLIAVRNKLSRSGVLLTLALAGMVSALLLTLTRASWLAFLISAFVMALVYSTRWRAVLIVTACALPIAVAALFLLQQHRNVGFYDQKDQSITWRETVWKEGFNLLVSEPRHLLVGVGMNSIKRHWREWGMFDQGRIPVGHMHSTPLQLAVERGVPALIAWLLLMLTYGRTLYRLLRSGRVEGRLELGIILGTLGGLIGFLSSGVVHYNWGDSEVVMIFYMLMGFSLFLFRESAVRSASEKRSRSFNR